jgi:hypothetical protein|mmetsp:Transcript_29718/g.54423  ORF Transcript_29718/g.54423 Transcript_29718/m.54423 type:complete len:233 (-) Transcript_29718:179-877(-)|eukprot:CAMPEP_0198292396 /NCGR_PEP_ID=MMETSP1449-20131203/11973_1 /TAXON_ID=420275 /ORGANISM="Attheya septentrionalis, Strain CCMP2084" /LENGTH=232 /DNA_ID=CAMNT_0043991411 /DNA_START=284 /DNA_END=982 /DNA_ORIENTATION=+
MCVVTRPTYRRKRPPPQQQQHEQQQQQQQQQEEPRPASDLEDGGSSLTSELTDGHAGRAEEAWRAQYNFFPPERGDMADGDGEGGGLLPCTYHESPTSDGIWILQKGMAFLWSMYHAILDGCLFVVVICMGCLLYDVEVTIRDSSSGDPDGRAFGRVVIRDETHSLVNTTNTTTLTQNSQVRVSAAALHRAHSMASTSRRRGENVTSIMRQPHVTYNNAPIHSSYRPEDGIV